ncbi:MAG: SDR family oxidoreductase [Sphingobacteriales bacterium]|nr:MAG: SDR family oxidoreductase [Sphingobacteriales bacterium]
MAKKKIIKDIPAQVQEQQPGIESKMNPQPLSAPEEKAADKKLSGKVAIISGGDSGIGRATALDFIKEGAKVVIAYLSEDQDARDTEAQIKKMGGECLLFKGDISKPAFCNKIAAKTMTAYGRIDIVVSNAAIQFVQEDIMAISKEQLELTFRTNVFAAFYLTQACLPHLKAGASIIYTSSVTAFRGSDHLIDYAATKAALIGLCRSLSASLADKQIRVNAVAPGPIWTPLIPASFPKKEVAKFGKDTPMKRCGQPNEVAPCFTFLASDAASYITGQVLHPNGGEIVA